MTAARILFDQTAHLRRAAVFDAAGAPLDLFVDRLDRPSLENGVFLGRVQRILKDRNAVFVDVGGGVRVMLAASDVRPAPAKDVPVGAVLRAGQTIVVQVKADAVGGKAPAASMDVALPSRRLTHLPLGRGVLASRRLAADEATRKALRASFAAKLPAGTGWIVRAAALSADDAALAAEAAALTEAWRRLETAALAASGGEPRVLAPPPDATARALEAYGGPETVVAPAGVEEGAALDAALAALSGPIAPLSGGGRLIVETTAALTAVDVDGGGGSALAVNLAAAGELARQLRLRNLGGAVVVDFIRMPNRNDQEKVLQRLRRATADDPAQTDVYGFTRLGHVELTRARRGAGLAETLAGLPVAASAAGDAGKA